jgi:MFS family permease
LYPLFLVIIVAGISQGLLLPLLTILLDQAGISPETNGLHSAALYIGIFSTMFFIERPVRKLGYKPIIITGILLITGSVLLFPLWQNVYIWILLRLFVGAGNSALHYAAQLWVISSSTASNRGRVISLYGMSYGIGFAIGPFGLNLLHIGIWMPFVTVGLFFLLVLVLLLRLPNHFPENAVQGESVSKRAVGTFRLAWFALLPSLIYGYMESSLNSNFPLYGLRIGLTQESISWLLPTLGLGGLLLQIPLGIWSDRIGRKPVLMLTGMVGAIVFLAVPFAGDHVWRVALLFAIVGAMVGSFFSLGLAYAADILPKSLLPTANLIGSIQFSVGSIIGPALGGFTIRYLSPAGMFYLLGALFLLYALSGSRFNRPHLGLQANKEETL